MSRTTSVRIALLDNQVVDRDRLPIGRIDDLEIVWDETPRVTTLLTGSEALGDRIGGAIGRWMSAVSARLRSSPEQGPPTLDVRLIEEFEPLVQLGVEFEELDDVAGLEHWLAANLIERLPGTGHARK